MLGLKPEHKKYIRPVTGLIIFVAGIVLMLIPFIPAGYILIIAGAFLLAPEIPFMKRFLGKLKKWDHSHRIEKAEQKVNEIEDKVNRTLIDDGKK